MMKTKDLDTASASLATASTTPGVAPSRWKVVILSQLALLLAVPACAQTRGGEKRDSLPPIIRQAAQELPRIQAGDAVIERLGKVYVDAQGPHAAARAGDWKLSNDQVALYFAAVDEEMTSESMPIAGYHEVLAPANRVPGALIDVTMPGREMDFVAFFTQGVGTKTFGAKVLYDTAQPVERDGAVGLELEGSPFDNALLRLRTTYLLKEGDTRVSVESRVLDTDPGLPLPELSDIGQWYSGAMLIEGGRMPSGAQDSMFSGKFYAINGDVYTMAVAPTTGTLQGTYSLREGIFRTRLEAEATTQTTGVAAAADEKEGILLTRRSLWFGAGMFDTVTEPIYASRGEVSGILEGRLVADPEIIQARRQYVTVFKVGVESVDEQTGIIEGDGTIPALFTITETDAEGNYRVALPPGFYIPTPEYNINPTQAYAGIDRVTTEASTRRNFQVIDPSAVRVTVVDDATSRPLEARVRIEGVDPTPDVSFGFDIRRLASLNNVYVPREGRLIALPPGNYLLHATHGPRYSVTEMMVKVEPKQVGEQTIRIRETAPTPDWIGIEMGARTTATPGCSIPAEAYVRMAAAEGLDWIISGDYEQITDFQPIIEKLGLGDQLRSSRGFRTLLPAHPEWGHLFVYPVQSDAPDPARAREQWAGATTAKEWIAAVRKAYPGSIIQVDTPWNRPGQGYFSRGETNVYVASHTPAIDAEWAVDAINILSARSAWEFDTVMARWYNHWIAGRQYIASTAPLARHIYGGEPGYPRLMAKIEQPLTEIKESDLFGAIRKGRTQLTNGPFIQWGGQGVTPGDILSLQANPELRVRITSNNWSVPSRISVDKEGVPQILEILHLEPEEIQRYPPPGEGTEFKTHTMKTLRVISEKDTLLGVSAIGFSTPLDTGLPPYSPAVNNYPFAAASPIIIDANGNNAYDPLTTYPHRGR